MIEVIETFLDDSENPVNNINDATYKRINSYDEFGFYIRSWILDISKELEKGKTYIENPSDAPKGVKVETGERGGYYYDVPKIPERVKPVSDQLPASRPEQVHPTRFEQVLPNRPEQVHPSRPKNTTVLDNDDIVKYLGQNKVFHESKAFKMELNYIFDKEIKKILEGTEKFTGEDMKKFVDRIVKDAIRNMQYRTGTHLEDIYKAGQQYVGDITRSAISFSKIDTMAIKAIQDSDVLFDAYHGMSKALSEKLNLVIENAYADPETFSLSNMIEKMRKEADIETYRLERIVRTETQSASMTGREIGFKKYDPEDIKRFDWAVKHDSRTSSVCKKIQERVEAEGNNQGVSLTHLRGIVKDESMKYNGTKWKYRNWVPHINCRSGLVVHI